MAGGGAVPHTGLRGDAPQASPLGAARPRSRPRSAGRDRAAVGPAATMQLRHEAGYPTDRRRADVVERAGRVPDSEIPDPPATLAPRLPISAASAWRSIRPLPDLRQ